MATKACAASGCLPSHVVRTNKHRATADSPDFHVLIYMSAAVTRRGRHPTAGAKFRLASSMLLSQIVHVCVNKRHLFVSLDPNPSRILTFTSRYNNQPTALPRLIATTAARYNDSETMLITALNRAAERTATKRFRARPCASEPHQPHQV